MQRRVAKLYYKPRVEEGVENERASFNWDWLNNMVGCKYEAGEWHCA